MFGSEKGVVMVIAAIILVSLLILSALVVDVGQLYMVRSRLQTAADAAASAGAVSLINNNQDPVQATNDARTYVNANLQGSYQFTPTVNPNSSKNTFQASISQNVPLFFAPIIGIQSQTVSVQATAQAQSVIAVNGVVPFGVVQQQFQYMQQYTLKYGAGSKPAQGGNYGALALGGNGASRYRDNIEYGYQGTLTVGDVVSTEPGNMAGPTDQGVSYRKGLCTSGCTPQTIIEVNCPRVVITPVIDQIPSGGRGSVTILGFAAFFLEDTQDSESKGQKDVIGVFLRWTTPGKSGTGSDFGLHTVKLIQ